MIAPSDITIPNKLDSGIIITKNILVEDGSLVLQDHGSNEYTFVKFNVTDQAIQLSHKLPLTSDQTNMNLRTKLLNVSNSLYIGTDTALNGLDLKDGFRLEEPMLPTIRLHRMALLLRTRCKLRAHR